MTTRYFGGNTLAAFFRSSTGAAEITTAGRFDSTYVASCVALGGALDTDYIETSAFSATGTIWTVFEVFRPNTNPIAANIPLFFMLNGSTNVFRIVTSGSNVATMQCQYWNGSAWTNTGSTFTLSLNARARLAIKVILNTSFEVYAAGSLVASGSSWSGGGTTVTKFRLGNVSAAAAAFSQALCADYDIRDSHYLADTLNGNSATNTGGTGSYTTINETVLDESTGVSIATTGNKQGQTHTGITVPAGYVIGGMIINARGRATGTVTDGKLGVRSGGTNYSSSGLAYNGGYEPRCYIVADDPATATRFTQSGFNAAEIYEEAA